MPTYEYLCQDCDQPLEVFQSFTDDALTTCPECGGSLRKVFGSVGVVFKGSGFYRTDSRDKASATAPGTPKKDDAAKPAEAKPASAPAAPAPAAQATSSPSTSSKPSTPATS